MPSIRNLYLRRFLLYSAVCCTLSSYIFGSLLLAGYALSVSSTCVGYVCLIFSETCLLVVTFRMENKKLALKSRQLFTYGMSRAWQGTINPVNTRPALTFHFELDMRHSLPSYMELSCPIYTSTIKRFPEIANLKFKL